MRRITFPGSVEKGQTRKMWGRIVLTSWEGGRPLCTEAASGTQAVLNRKTKLRFLAPRSAMFSCSQLRADLRILCCYYQVSILLLQLLIMPSVLVTPPDYNDMLLTKATNANNCFHEYVSNNQDATPQQ